MCICDLAQVRQDEVGIIEKFGKFERIAEPGCHLLWCAGCVYEAVAVWGVAVRQESLWGSPSWRGLLCCLRPPAGELQVQHSCGPLLMS